MFKVALSPEFWAPVAFEYQGEDGSRKQGKFEVRFRRLPVEQMQEITGQNRAEGGDDAALLKKIVVDWRGIADADGKEIDFEVETGCDLLFSLGLGGPVIQAFIAALPRARAKN